MAAGNGARAAERDLPAAPARVPAGFRIETLASDLSDVRMMAFSPDGRLFATQTGQGRIVVVPMGQGTPTAWATGRNQPHGIAFHQGHLYVADTNAVVRWPYQPGSSKAPGAPQRLATLPSGAGHFTRTLGFGPDGKLYVSVGSSCNVCIEGNPHRAAILQMNPDGSGLRIYAAGLRNAVGFTWDSQGRMWATDNGTDRMGDDFPPEELNLIRDGGFYGWPYDRLPPTNLPPTRWAAAAMSCARSPEGTTTGAGLVTRSCLAHSMNSRMSGSSKPPVRAYACVRSIPDSAIGSMYSRSSTT